MLLVPLLPGENASRPKSPKIWPRWLDTLAAVGMLLRKRIIGLGDGPAAGDAVPAKIEILGSTEVKDGKATVQGRQTEEQSGPLGGAVKCRVFTSEVPGSPAIL
jgi:hypothetical protein